MGVQGESFCVRRQKVVKVKFGYFDQPKQQWRTRELQTPLQSGYGRNGCPRVVREGFQHDLVGLAPLTQWMLCLHIP